MDRSPGGLRDGYEAGSDIKSSVPLSTGALGVLEQARALSPESSLVFPSITGGSCQGTRAGARALGEPGSPRRFTGFRSSARSWGESGAPAEVAEACLAHVPRSQVV